MPYRSLIRVLPSMLMGIACALPRAPSSVVSQPAAPTTQLAANEYYSWMLRAEHPDEVVLGVGDSLDVVLMRHRCRGGGCYASDSIEVTPRWILSGIARVRHLQASEWPSPPGFWSRRNTAARARVYGIRPGRTFLTAAIGDEAVSSATITVIAAAAAVRVAIEPRPDSVFAGDTIRLRATARDADGRVVAILPPSGGAEIGPPDPLGYVSVSTWPHETYLYYVARLGRRADTIHVPVVTRRNAVPVPNVISPELQAVLRREASPCGAVPAADTTGWRHVTEGTWSAIVPANYRRIDTMRFPHGGARWGYGSRWFGVERGIWMNRRPGTTTDMVPCRATFAGREYIVQGGRNATGGYDILAVPADATEVTTAMMGHADDLDGWYALWAMLAMALR